MQSQFTTQQLIRQRDYWKGKASERRHDVNRLERTLNEARLAKIDAQREARQNFERANLAEIRANQAEERLTGFGSKDHEIARLVQLLDDSEEREEDLKRQVSGIRRERDSYGRRLTAVEHERDVLKRNLEGTNLAEYPSKLFKALRERDELEGRLSRSKQVGDHLSKMLREARQRERDAEERADHLRDKLAQSTTRNIEQGRQIETLSASVGDSDRVRASIHATDVSDISEAITRYVDEAIEEHVVEEHVDD